jgi:hypothetical protein
VKYALIAILFSIQAFGYSIEFHGKLSALSFKVLKSCGLNSSLDSNLVIESSIDEDTDPYKAWGVFSRIWNWHFYGEGFWQQKSSSKYSLNKTFSRRWKDLLTLRDQAFLIQDPIQQKKEISNIAGALAHYIQDVTNPAHIVPIYHGPGRLDSFDYYTLKNNDYNFFSQKICEDILRFSKLKSISDILKMVAFATFQNMKKEFIFLENDTARKIMFSKAYWQYPQASTDFFGRYGEFGNSFGETDLDDRKNIKIDQAVFDDFFFAQNILALIGSSALILKIQ